MTEETTPPATEAPTTEPAATFDGDLVGTFSIDDAVCTDAANVTGSYFRMLQPGGTLEAGPFIPNADSACVDTTYSGLTAGTDGGLVTGAYQAAPDPAFDATGNGLADAIFAPVTFFAVAFAGATDPAEAMPTLTATDGALTGDLSAFTAYYGDASFNQGAPKPDGSGEAPVGTIDPETGCVRPRLDEPDRRRVVRRLHGRVAPRRNVHAELLIDVVWRWSHGVRTAQLATQRCR